jgi:hypothetical protein
MKWPRMHIFTKSDSGRDELNQRIFEAMEKERRAKAFRLYLLELQLAYDEWCLKNVEWRLIAVEGPVPPMPDSFRPFKREYER